MLRKPAIAAREGGGGGMVGNRPGKLSTFFFYFNWGTEDVEIFEANLNTFYPFCPHLGFKLRRALG